MRTSRRFGVVRRSGHTRAPGLSAICVGAVGLLAACAGACGESTGAVGVWPGSVDTLDNGVVLVRNPPPDEWTPEPWRIEEDLRIGSLEASDRPDEFADVADVAVDGRGRLYVSHRQPPEIRVFDADGRFVRRFGREGSGPGEFGRSGELTWGPDGNLWVADSGNGRFEVFDTAGAHVSSHRYSPGMYAYGDRWRDDGLLYTNVAARGRAFRLMIVRRRLMPEGLVPVDTLPAFGYEIGPSFPVELRRGDRRFMLMAPMPFQQRSIAVLRPGVGWWISDPGGGYRIARTDLAGDTIVVIERSYRPVPVTAADVDSVLERFDGAELPRDRIADVHPPVDDLIALPDGSLLVRRRDHAGQVLDAYDQDGRFQGSVHVPELDRITFHEATNSALYGVRRGQLDIPIVVRLRIGR